MAITPAAGWMVDPNNPNGVIPIPGGAPAQQAVQAQVAGTPPPGSNSGALVKDPTTGAFTLAPGSDMSPVPSSMSLGSLAPQVAGATPQTNAMGTGIAPSSDPYTAFINNISGMLADAQSKNNTAQTNLGGAVNTLTNTSVSGAGPTPFNPSLGSNSQVAGQEQMQAAFTPAITSLNTQMENENNANANIGTIASDDMQFFKPQALAPGQSLVSPSGTVISQGHQYSPQVNPNTGLLDGFDVNSGTWASEDKSGTTPSTLNAASGTVGGVDFSGASVGMQPWATDPNYATEVNGLYTQISNSQPIPTAPGLDAFIKTMAKGSPITGAMIINAATTYQVDPNLLAAVIGHESDFGTAGTSTLQINNPAGITGSDGKYTPFDSWTQGVNATAADLSKRTASAAAAQTSPPTATSPVGGSFSAQASQKIAALPTAYQSYVDAGPLGVAYINDDRVPDNIKQGLQTMASRAGIPYVQDADVGALKSIGTVLDNLDSMQTLAANNLGSGVLGHLTDLTAGAASQALQTPWGIQLGLFDNYRDVAIKAVQALAGGAGSGLRINMGEIAANTANLPQASDSQQNAVAQIKQLKQLIYTQLSTTFPYAMVPVVNKDGQTGQIPAGNLSGALQAGFTIQ